MPELPDVSVYVECLRPRVVDQPLERARIRTPFLLRSVEPALKDAEGKVVRSVERIGKRIAIGLEGDLFLLFHLMIAGRFRWRKRGVKIPGRYGLAAFDFPTGSLLLTEMGHRKRASLHLVAGRDALGIHDRGGLEVLDADLESFRTRLLSENHTLKRSLTDPRIFSGIGNAYSDEILHHARLSPLKWSSRLTDEEIGRLHASTVEILRHVPDRRPAPGRPRSLAAAAQGLAPHPRGVGEPQGPLARAPGSGSRLRTSCYGGQAGSGSFTGAGHGQRDRRRRRRRTAYMPARALPRSTSVPGSGLGVPLKPWTANSWRWEPM